MRCGHGQRVAGISAAQAAGVGRVHDGGAARNGRQRGASAHALGHGHQVGRDAKVLHGKHLAGAAVAGLHFVSNQHNTVLVAQGAQPLHGLSLDGVETALALHRLKNDGSHTRRLDVALEQLLHGVFGVLQICAMARERHVVNLGGKGAKARLVGLDLASERHRKQAAAVEGAAKGNDAAAPSVRAGDLDGVLNRLGAGREERGFGGAVDGHDGVDALGQRHVLRIGHDLVAAVGKALQLFGNRCLDLGVAVAGVEDRDAAHKVNVAAAFDVPQLGVFGVVDEKVSHHGHAARGGGQAAGVPFGVGAQGRFGGGGQVFGFQIRVHGGLLKGESGSGYKRLCGCSA